MAERSESFSCFHAAQNEPKNNVNEEVLRISQSFSSTRASPSNSLVSYPGYSLGGFTPMQRCSRCILQLQPTRPLRVVSRYFLKARWELHKNAQCWFGPILKQNISHQHLYGHSHTILQILQVRRAIHVGHRWRKKKKKDQLISDVLS